MNMKSLPAGNIIILGGGTAGWITANTLVQRWGDKGCSVTLIESPEIGTVGVGEGSTPRLKQFFDSIGVAESEWMPACNATYKNGITFAGWATTPGYERYFHPFPSRIDEHTITPFYVNTLDRRRGLDVVAHPDRFFLAALLAARRAGPIPNENFPFALEYGYHFDAHLLGEFLKRKAVAKGVNHIEARVLDIRQSDDGSIESLRTDADEVVAADFFIDCSGFGSVLLQQALGVPFRSFAENLCNDAAVVLPTRQSGRIGSETVSTAMRHGWCWEIPLVHRIGNGYVYSTSYCSADEAETELRDNLGLLESDTPARHLKMRVGRVEEHWHKNCLAVGLSQGFIEPLEATALNIVCNTVADFAATIEREGNTAGSRAQFNQRAGERFERIRDYIVAHYRLNSRDDTAYWRDNRHNTSPSDTFKRISQCWTNGENLAQEFERQSIRSAYGPMSWCCIFAGHGVYPDLHQQQPHAKVNMAEVDEFLRRCAMNFRSQNELLGV